MTQRPKLPAPSVTQRLILALVAIFFLAAPTAGDFGCFATPVTDLDPGKFLLAKLTDDCEACIDCGFTTATCAAACAVAMSGALPDGGAIPDQCYPLVQDGEVCLRALEAASCSDYESYVSDEGSTVPTECDFCPPRPDAGAD